MNLSIDQVRGLLKNHSSILPPSASIKISPGCGKTDGYVSYLYKVTIATDNPLEKQELIIKCAPEDEAHRQLMTVRILYLSEIYFYSIMMPEFYKLEKQFNVNTKGTRLPMLPKFIKAVTTECKEVLILEDVRQFGYQMRDKKLFFDEHYIKFMLMEFAKFHAFSFALNYKNRTQFEELVKGLKDIHGGKNCNLNDETNSWYRAVLKQVKELFQEPEDFKVLQKLEYIDDHLEDYCETMLEYQGPFGVVSHMDCWNNNMLFRYKGQDLDSICILDFQYVYVVSPALDFSFIFYVNGKCDQYHKLNEYLEHYYQCLREHTQLLDVAIDNFYPYSKFLEEINAYARYGFLRALIGVPMSMRLNDEIIDVKDVVDQGIETSRAFGVERFNPECAEWMRKLTLHHFQNHFL